MAPDVPTAADGRRARRERNRTAVIDAMFALLEEGHLPPSVEQVASRAEVSVSSVFRYFESLDDLQEQTIARYFERFAPLFEVPAVDGDRDARIAALVDARLALYERVAPIAQMARVRAAGEARFARALLETRRRMADQVGAHLAPDVAHLGRAEADDRIALVDCLTAFESWDLLTSTHGRSRRLVRRAWLTGIAAILA